MTKNKERLNINSVFERYERHMTLNNFSPYTIKLVKRCYKDFMLFVDNDDFLIEDVTSDTIDDYILWLVKKENKDVTINIKLSDMRMFLYWAMEKGYLKEFKIKLVKEEKTIRKTYSENQLSALLEKPDVKTCTFIEYRSWVVVNFLLGTGARSMTTMHIKIEDVDFDNNLLTFTTTKNKSQMIVPMSINLSDILIEYLTYRGGEPNDYLFCDTKGQQVTRAGLRSSIYRYNKARGVDLTSLHSFRHTYAKMFIMNGGNLFVLQKLLGHKSIRSTQVYVNLLTDDLEKDYDKFNPLDVLMDKNKTKTIKMKR